MYPENKLPGMGGVYRSMNLGLYKYSGQNPVRLVDPDGRLEKMTDADINSQAGMRYHPVLKTLKYHKGSDYSASMWTPVHSKASGKVAYAGKMTGYGNVVIINHGKYTKGPLKGMTVSTLVAHLDEISVSEGEAVGEGQPIGMSGKTGRVTGPHTHEEMRIGVVKPGRTRAYLNNSDDFQDLNLIVSPDHNPGRMKWQNDNMVERSEEEMKKDIFSPEYRK